MDKKEINILGAGISGLACAIIFRKNGYVVNVYEKQKNIGSRFNEDWQGIENWSEDIDVLKQIESYGIDISFEYSHLTSEYIHLGKRKKLVNLEQSVYLVRRGKKDGTLDKSLLDQARKIGVNVYFNSKVLDDSIPIHVNATGPKSSTMGLAKGIKFTTTSNDSYHMAFGVNIAKGYYSYLVIKDGHGTIATMFNRKLSGRADEFLENTISLFADYVDKRELSSGKKFGGYGHFEIKKSPYDPNGALLIGEAGGFQDYFLGFGMRYAFQSAYFAAKSIIDNQSYEELVRINLHKKMKHSVWNRSVFEFMGRFSYPLAYYSLTKGIHRFKYFR